jgi:Dolichyl-phosphate-mannose-protein mannosyltransferase
MVGMSRASQSRAVPNPPHDARPIVLQVAVKPVSLQAETVDATRWLDTIAVAVLALVALIAAATFRDYGLGWDDYAQSQYGRLLVSLYSSGFADKRALSYINIYMYGGGFDMLSTLAAKVLPFSLFETRRLVGAAIGIVGLFIAWRLGRRLGGPLAGLITLLLLAACPLYYGHMFINCKDAPFATAMIFALLAIVRAFEEYPRATPATMALIGLSFGLAIGTRVLGGFALLEALLPLLIVIVIRSRALGLKQSCGECAKFLLPFIPGAILAFLVMGLVWPWSVAAPLNVFRAVGYFSHDFEKPWQELFDGRLIPIVAMPASYVPTLFAVQLPELLLALGIFGWVGALVAAGRSELPGGIGRRAGLLAIVLAVALPLLLTIVMRPYIYNGVRQLLFIVPPFAVLAGLTAAWIWRRLRPRGLAAMAAGVLVLLAGIVSPVVDMIRLHPYEYTDFNHIVGGVRGARPLFMLDYWGLSMTQASRQLVALLAERHETPPEGKWTFSVCGPEPPVAVALGPAFMFTQSPKQANFAVSLGEFYCAKLDAPLLVQIVRNGVVYARVYDISGRSFAKLTVK